MMVMLVWLVCCFSNASALQFAPICIGSSVQPLHNSFPSSMVCSGESPFRRCNRNPETHVLDRWCSRGDGSSEEWDVTKLGPIRHIIAPSIRFSTPFPVFYHMKPCSILSPHLVQMPRSDPLYRQALREIKVIKYDLLEHQVIKRHRFTPWSMESTWIIFDSPSCPRCQSAFSCIVVRISDDVSQQTPWQFDLNCRVGEALNPGPSELSIKSCNPTTIANRVEDFQEMLPAIIGVSESAATSTVQKMMTTKFREVGVSCEWSAPVPSYASSSSNIRGVAGGTAVLSPFPIRRTCEEFPDDIVASNRFCESHVQFRPHRFMSVISLYGPTDHFKYGDPNTVLNRLFSFAAQRSIRFCGPAVIMGDLNAPLSKLDVWPSLQAQGWIDAAEVSSLKNSHPLDPTYFEVSRHTFILVNRALGQSLISCRTVLHHLFAGHPVLDARFDLDCLLSPTKIWSLPKSFDRFLHDPVIAEEAACRRALQKQSALVEAIDKNDIDKFAKVWTNIAELTLSDSAVTADGKKQYIKPGHFGRASKCVFKEAHNNVPISKRARNGDYQPLMDQCSVELRRCTKQLHRLQSICRQVECLQRKFKFEALQQAHHLWDCIYLAKGFHHGFATWALDIAGLFIPRTLPPLALVVSLRDAFASWHSNNEKQAWLAKTKIKSLDIIADLSKGGKLAFQQVKTSPLSPLTQLHEKISAPIRKTAWSKGGEKVLFGGPFDAFDPNLPVRFQDQSSLIAAVKSDRIVLQEPFKLRSALSQDMILEQENILVEPKAMHSSLCKAWNSFFQRDNPDAVDNLSENENRLLNKIQSCQVMDLPEITGSDIQNAVMATKLASGRGSDGFSTLDLRKLPIILLDMLAILFKQIELGGVWPSRWSFAKTICLPKTESARSPYDVRPVTVMARMYRVWGKIRGKQVSVLLSQTIPPEIGGPCKGVAADMIALLTSFKIEKSLLEHEVLAGIVIDIVKCYNTVPRGVLLQLLRKLGTPPGVLRAFRAMMCQMQRFFELMQSCSDLHATTAGIIEGCGFAIPSMLSLGILAFRVLQTEAVECECAFFADNWSLYASDSSLLTKGFEALKTVISDLSMKIAPSKSWSWATDSHTRKQLESLCVENQPIPVLSHAKDLGVQQCYTKQKRKAVVASKLVKAKNKLAVIKKVKVPRGCKKRLAMGAGLAVLTYGTAVQSVATKDLHSLRVSVAKALSRSGSGANAFLACNVVDVNLDPEMRLINQRFQLWRRFLRTFPVYRSFVLQAMFTLQNVRGISRKVGSIHAFVASVLLLNGEVLDEFGKIKLGDYSFRWTDVSPKFLAFVIQQAWTRYVATNRINRNGFCVQDFDAIGNEHAYNKLAPMDKALVDSLISGRHCTNEFLAKFMPGVDPVCSLCRSQDSRRHRLFDCPALAKFRQGKIGLKRASKWPQCNSSFGLCPAVPSIQDRIDAISGDIPLNIPDPVLQSKIVFTDGSAFFADVKQLTISASAYIVTAFGSCCVEESESTIVPSPEQNSFVAELYAIILVLNKFFRVHIFSDCQVVCDLVTRAVNGQCVKQQVSAHSTSLWVQLMSHISKRPPGAIMISKVKAHLNHRNISDPELRWKVWANNQVDRIAKDTLQIQHRRLFRKLEKIYQQVSCNRRDIVEVYNFWAFASLKCIQAETKKRKEHCQPNVLDCSNPAIKFATTGRMIPYNLTNEHYLCFPWGPIFLWRVVAWAKQLVWPSVLQNAGRDVSFAELYIDFQLTTGSRAPRNVSSAKQRDKCGFSLFILDDIESRADVGPVEFSFQCETWTRAMTWLMTHSPEGFFPAGIKRRTLSLAAIGCSAWYKGLEVRPKLVCGHKAATCLHNFFISSEGTHRYMKRQLDIQLPKPMCHPQWLQSEFSDRVPLMRKAKSIFNGSAST